LTDPLVARFIRAVAPMVLCVEPKVVPSSWSLWFDPKAAATAVDASILSFLSIFPSDFLSQPDDCFDWLDVFPYRKGDDIVEQDDVYLLPLSQPLHDEESLLLEAPSVSTSSLKRPRPCTFFLSYLISLS